MTLPRRHPRQAYRVYAEDEFLAIDEWPEETELDPAPGEALRGRPRRPLGRRPAGVAATVAVAMTAGAIVAHDLRSERPARGHGSLAAAADSQPRERAPAMRARSRPARWGSRRAKRGIRSAVRASRVPSQAIVERSEPVARVPLLTASTSDASPPGAGSPRARPEFGFER